MDAKRYNVLIIGEEHAPALRDDLADEFDLLQAASGEQGLALFARAKPDAVLLHHTLRDRQALEVLRALTRAVQRCAIILLARDQDGAIGIEAAKAGAHDCLDPNALDGNQLKHALRNALNAVALKNLLEQQQAASGKQQCSESLDK
jgi:DNA-binding NarL/FixJ family response regulator